MTLFRKSLILIFASTGALSFAYGPGEVFPSAQAAPASAPAKAPAAKKAPLRKVASTPIAAPAAPQTQTTAAAIPPSDTTVEETNAIERAIEDRVRDILDGIVGAESFAVYVQATLKPDPQMIQAYHEERLLHTLPGIPVPDSEATNVANNRLYALVKQQKIIVVLDKSVSAEQEQVAKEILKSKLDIKDGQDSLEIRRAQVAGTQGHVSPVQGATSTERWVRYALIALAVAFVMAVLLLLWQISLLRERLSARAKLSADVQTEPNGGGMLPGIFPPTAAGGGAGSETAGASQEETPEIRPRRIREPEMIGTAELKEKILTLAVGQPKACSLVARRLLATREGVHKLAVVCEAVGFEYARQLFDTVSPGKWKVMGDYLRENMKELHKAPVGQILLEVYTDMLAECMGWDPSKQGEGPFDFLHKLQDAELEKMLAQEQPDQIAFISAFWEPEEMAHLINNIADEKKRKEVVLQMARLSGLPKEVVHQAAVRFAERLKFLRNKNEVDVDGSEVVARVLGNVDTNVEEELLKFIEDKDPDTRNKIRGVYFSFDSIVHVPGDVLTSVIPAFDAVILTRGLVGADETITSHILSVLPPKQKKMIHDDIQLASMQNTVSKAQVADSRKMILIAIRKALKDRGISLAQLLLPAQDVPPGASTPPAPPAA